MDAEITRQIDLDALSTLETRLVEQEEELSREALATEFVITFNQIKSRSKDILADTKIQQAEENEEKKDESVHEANSREEGARNEVRHKGNLKAKRRKHGSESSQEKMIDIEDMLAYIF
ncbi:hypothetical protein Tco_0669460 [Tanacetum coccineum]